MYLEPQEDGLFLRNSRQWTEEKLDYLQRYLDIFLITMKDSKRKWRSINFIDLFSGPGKCRIDNSNRIVLGSPLLALTHSKYKFDHYFFSDTNDKALTALKTRCEKADLNNVNISYYCEDGNIAVDKIINLIQKMDDVYIEKIWNSLNLAFLDPEGLELRWSTIEKLSKVKKMDLIIYFSVMGVNREMPNEIDLPSPTKLDIFFGGNEWRDIYKRNCNPSTRRKEIHDLYRQKLISLGYLDIRETEPVIRNKTHNAPLYCLFFASKNKVGNDFWRKVVQRDIYGQNRLL